jgi:hypothetical protein
MPLVDPSIPVVNEAGFQLIIDVPLRSGVGASCTILASASALVYILPTTALAAVVPLFVASTAEAADAAALTADCVAFISAVFFEAKALPSLDADAVAELAEAVALELAFNSLVPALEEDPAALVEAVSAFAFAVSANV